MVNIAIIMLIFIIIPICYTNKNEIHGPFTEEEYKEMRQLTSLISEILTSKNTTVSKVEGFLTSMETEIGKPQERVANHTDTFICKACLWSLTRFHNLLEKKYGLFIFNDLLAVLCSIGLDFKICKAAIDLYSPTIIDSLIEHYLDAEYLCTKSHICKVSHYIELDPDDYARELLKDKPQSMKPVIDPNGKTLKILHVTDIHTDLLYLEVIFILINI